jgi:hypothetical protein
MISGVATAALIEDDAAMPALWITVAISFVVSIVFLFLHSRRASRAGDLGVISERWIAQHRAGSRDGGA